MGQLIDLAKFRKNKKSPPSASKKAAPADSNSVEGSTNIVLAPAVSLLLQFVPYKNLQADDFKFFARNLFADQALPDLTQVESVVLNEARYHLERFTKKGDAELSRALYFARLHLERRLEIECSSLVSVMRFTSRRVEGREAILARRALGIFSIIWQIATDQELVTDDTAMTKLYGQE